MNSAFNLLTKTTSPSAQTKEGSKTDHLPAPSGQANEPRFEPGEVLAGRYRVAGALGRGGMGEVYRADDLELGGVVALKFLSTEIERDERRLAMLLSEARIARTVSHPHVCRVHDIGMHRNQDGRKLHFLSMEYIDGENLSSLLRRIGRLPKPKAISVAQELCAGLTAVHSCGLLHRDIKPSNVMLDGRGCVRLTDFGLAIISSEATGLAGTPAYMAPEQLTLQETTTRSDIYSLGLVLYEIFTGKRAFTAASPKEYAWKQLQCIPEAPSSLVEDLPPEIDKLILACLEKSPEKRIDEVEKVGLALAGVDSKGASAASHVKEGEVLRALLHCDLVGSTALVETLGDRRAAELGASHDRLTRDLLARHEGHEIDKTDGFLLLFERPIQALSFALEYHTALDLLSGKLAQPLKARAGIHFGELWLRENPLTDVRRGAKPVEIDGLAKVLALRLQSLARGGQTLLSSGAFDLARRAAVGLEDSEDLRWLDHGSWRLHGIAEPVDVYEVGREGQAPLEPPMESERFRRLLMQPRVAGWRPAPGLSVPGRNLWQVERRLGEGGFGEAWLVRHTKTRTPRCFKFCFDAGRLQALQREITLFRLLKEELGERADINRLLDWNLDEPPFFIESEYTSAGDLAQWAEAEGGLANVPLEVRLEIVAQIATALAAAHSVGVLHKDVKPSNILISYDSERSIQAQLADFGVGRVTEKERLAAAGITMLGLSRRTRGDTTDSRSGTPLYLAPEILEGRAPTHQADIYALGVLLFQAVAGDFRRAFAQGWQREITDDLLASDIASFVDGDPERRPTSAKEVALRLRTLKQRRQELRTSEDARRAMESSLRRRSIYKAVASTASVALVAVSLFAIWALQAGDEERRAHETTERILSFIISVFEMTDPSHPAELGELRGVEITARQILDLGAARLESEFTKDPLVKARLMATFGDIYSSWGLYEKAYLFYKRSSTIRESRLGAEHPATVGVMGSLATSLWNLGKYDEAKKLYIRDLEIRTRVFGPNHPQTLSTMLNLGNIQLALGDYEEARRLYKMTLDNQTIVLGHENPGTFRTMSNLANSYWSLGENRKAQQLYQKAFHAQIRLLGDDHPDTLVTEANMAETLAGLGEYSLAISHLERCISVQKRILGPNHDQTLWSMYVLAVSLARKGDLSAAELLEKEVLEKVTAGVGEDHWLSRASSRGLGEILLERRKWKPAEKLLQKALEAHKRVLVRDHPEIQEVKIHLAGSLIGLGEVDRAKELAMSSFKDLDAKLGPQHWLTIQAGRKMLEIALLENDLEATSFWLQKLRWLTEQDFDSAKHMEIKDYLLEVINEKST